MTREKILSLFDQYHRVVSAERNYFVGIEMVSDLTFGLFYNELNRDAALKDLP